MRGSLTLRVREEITGGSQAAIQEGSSTSILTKSLSLFLSNIDSSFPSLGANEAVQPV